MNPLRSVGARLGLGLAVVVAAALVLVDLIVVPSLERNLIDAKLAQLKEAAPSVGSKLLNTLEIHTRRHIQTAEASADARVIYFMALDYNPPRLIVYADSSPVTSADVEDDGLALRAFADERPVSGTVTTGGVRYAEAAYPLLGGPVVLLRAPLHDSLRSIQPRPEPAGRGRLDRPRGLARRRVPRRLVLRPPDPPARARRRSDRERRLQPAGGRLRRGTSSASSPPHSNGCASGSRSWSTPAGSSSPTRPMSCGRRCSRWADFSS